MTDRGKVIKGLEDSLANQGCGYMDGVGELYAVSGEDLQNAIALLKAQEPVKHGRWIKMTGMMPPEYHGHYECSECQWHMKGIRSSWTREEELTYCPNCGAKMEGEEENE